jgi:hypothetical protein
MAGFLFLFIIITDIASNRFGYETFSNLDPDTKPQKIEQELASALNYSIIEFRL